MLCGWLRKTRKFSIFFSDAPQSVLTARQGRQVRYGVRAARGLRHRYGGRGKWLRGCPDGHPLAGIRR